ncbi:response regulator [Nostocoides sp. HKS02]|nr:response regulator [Tetrasphaera sp. HKS02]
MQAIHLTRDQRRPKGLGVTQAEGTRVLVADDDPDIRDLVEFKLSQAGYAVQSVADGVAAWEAFQTERPALVVLDVMMPGLSGFDVLRKIRDSEWPTVPVLLLSAKSRDSDVDTGFAVGATDYVIKPFSPRELLHRVNGILARSQ